MNDGEKDVNATQLFNKDQSGPVAGQVTNVPTEALVTTNLTDLDRHMVFAARLQHEVSPEVGVNPLVSAAGEVLIEIARLQGGSRSDEHNYRKEMVEKIKAFEARAVQAGIASAEVMTARYILCAVVDQAARIDATAVRMGEWSKNSLLVEFHNDTLGGTKFFQLVERMSVSPTRHLYLLELMYLCLSLGFTGIHEGSEKGAEYIAATRIKLFQLIRSLRGQAPREVSPHWQGLPKARDKGVLIVPGWVVGAFTLTVVLAIYSGMSALLGHQRETVLQPFQTFESAMRAPQS